MSFYVVTNEASTFCLQKNLSTSFADKLPIVVEQLISPLFLLLEYYLLYLVANVTLHYWAKQYLFLYVNILKIFML